MNESFDLESFDISLASSQIRLSQIQNSAIRLLASLYQTSNYSSNLNTCTFLHFVPLLLLVGEQMLNIGDSTSPWKNPCVSNLNDSELRDTMCTRWEEDNIPRCVCVAICYNAAIIHTSIVIHTT